MATKVKELIEMLKQYNQEGYSAFSPELDEDLFKFEFTKFHENKKQ